MVIRTWSDGLSTAYIMPMGCLTTETQSLNSMLPECGHSQSKGSNFIMLSQPQFWHFGVRGHRTTLFIPVSCSASQDKHMNALSVFR